MPEPDPREAARETIGARAAAPSTADLPRVAAMAEFAMIAGIFSLATAFAPAGLLGLVLGALVLRAPEAARRSGGPSGGNLRSRAMAGMLCGGASVALMPLALTFALAPRMLIGSLPVVADATAASRRAADLDALRRIGAACLVYAALHEGSFPPTLTALSEAGQLRADDLRSRSAGQAGRACDYFYIAGLRPDDPPHWIMAYSDPRAAGGACVLRVDGSSEYLLRDGLEAELKRLTAEFRSSRGRDLSVVLPAR